MCLYDLPTVEIARVRIVARQKGRPRAFLLCVGGGAGGRAGLFVTETLFSLWPGLGHR